MGPKYPRGLYDEAHPDTRRPGRLRRRPASRWQCPAAEAARLACGACPGWRPRSEPGSSGHAPLGRSRTDRARRNLNQALYAIRQDLGSEEAILGTRDLRLNPEIVDADVVGFETASASGALEKAARLYGGPYVREAQNGRARLKKETF